jgi:hypothetical protein
MVTMDRVGDDMQMEMVGVPVWMQRVVSMMMHHGSSPESHDPASQKSSSRWLLERNG